MSTVKALRFPVAVRWREGRLLTADAVGKPPLAVATPPEFRGGLPNRWSPEELLVAAVAACFELTLIAVAERRRVPLRALAVEATGHVEHEHGSYGFTVVELEVELTTETGHEAAAEQVAALARRHCIVERALDVPVHVRLNVASLPKVA
jgi:organic hydroperoxide reductase OsmC/OhrA